jgi:hypothetical protein
VASRGCGRGGTSSDTYARDRSLTTAVVDVELVERASAGRVAFPANSDAYGVYRRGIFVTTVLTGPSVPLAYLHVVVARPEGQQVPSFGPYQNSWATIRPCRIATVTDVGSSLGGCCSGVTTPMTRGDLEPPVKITCA